MITSDDFGFWWINEREFYIVFFKNVAEFSASVPSRFRQSIAFHRQFMKMVPT